MASKRKRKPGGGRKAAGPYVGKTAALSIRITPEVRAELESAAKASDWKNVSQFAEYLLEKGLRDRGAFNRDPLPFHFANIMTETARRSSPVRGENWHTNRFQFEAFKVAINQILDRMAPAGKVGEHPQFKTPEELGRAMAFGIITDLETDTREAARVMRSSPHDHFYTFPRAAAFLGIKPKGGEKP